MKINFLGDSITQGVGASIHEETYTYLVCKYFGAEECNFGVSGTRIAAQRGPSFQDDWDEQFIVRAKRMGEADFTFVFGGTNDFGHGDAILGKCGDKSQYTFYGAFLYLANYLKEKFGKKLCFILPIPRFDQNDAHKEIPGEPLEKYIEAEKTILNGLHIEYLDLKDAFPKEVFSWTVDGVHPSPYGYKILANNVIEYLKKRL